MQVPALVLLGLGHDHVDAVRVCVAVVADPGQWEIKARYLGLEFVEAMSAENLALRVIEHETAEAIMGSAPLRPQRNLLLCLEAAYMRRIEAIRLKEIGPRYGLTPQIDTKSVRRVTDKGDALWALLGAWPWALFEDGRLPVRGDRKRARRGKRAAPVG
jgi:hypothetical protein